MNRIFYQNWSIVLCFLWEACHELFCISEDFYASGMQVAEVTKSLMTRLSYFHKQQKKIEPRELSDCLFPVTPAFEFHSKKPLCHWVYGWCFAGRIALSTCRPNCCGITTLNYVTNLHFFDSQKLWQPV